MFGLLFAFFLWEPHNTVVLNDQEVQYLAVDSRDYAWILADFASSSRVTKLNSNGSTVFSVVIPETSGHVIATDLQGNAYIAGASNAGSMFVAKLASTGDLVYKTSIGNGALAAIAVDPAGSVYVTGSASLPGLQATAGAFQPVSKGRDAFVLKLSPAGNRVVYSTFLGGDVPGCVGGIHCIGLAGILFYSDADAGRAIAVDADGNAYVTGTTNAKNFPVTGDGFQNTCPCIDMGYGVGTSVWVAKLNATGTGLLYSTFVTGGGDAPAALAIDAAGNAFVSGTTGSVTFPTTQGAVFTRFQGTPFLSNLFVFKLNPQGTALVYSTYLGSGTPGALALDSSGNTFVTGTVSSPDFPITPGALSHGGGFLLRLNAGGTALIDSTLLPNGVGGLGVAADSNGNPVVLGGSVERGGDTAGNTVVVRAGGMLTRFTAAAKPMPSIFGVANSASTSVASLLVPGELVSIYGVNLGPVSALSAQPGSTVNSQGDVSVYFNGIEAPLLYVSGEQIDAVVPYEIADAADVSAIVSFGGQLSNVLTFPRVDAELRIFTAHGQAVALNDDGTVNSKNNPAQPGSVLTVFATGAGLMSPAETDAAPGNAGSQPLLPLTCRIVSLGVPPGPVHDCRIVYAGSASFAISGVLQVSVKLPGDVTTPFPEDGSLQFQIGNRISVPVGISVGGGQQRRVRIAGAWKHQRPRRPAPSPTRAAFTPKCIGAGSGPCASSPDSERPRRPTAASTICCNRARRVSR